MKTLVAVMKENQWLTYAGWGAGRRGDAGALRVELSRKEDEAFVAVQWIEQYMRRQKGRNESRSSYGLKHICERMVGKYISNGVMIAAFLMHGGYEIARIRQSLNAEFNVSECACRVASAISNGRPPKGFVYFVRLGSENTFKIGMTTGLPEDRLASLQTASPIPLSLHEYITTDMPKIVERDLHERFKRHRIAGEWFQITPRMIADVIRDL